MSTKADKRVQTTDNFVSVDAANEQLALQGIHPLQVGHMILTGEISIGKPAYGRHQRLVVQDGRYLIKG